MGFRQEIELEHVRRLLAALGRPPTRLEPLDPPAPDVRAIYPYGSVEVFEVTEIHPDEFPGHGSAIRSAGARHAKANPGSTRPAWIQTNAIPAIAYRIEEKVRKAAGYTLQSNEALSLLLVGSIPQEGAVAATFAFPCFLTPEKLNAALNEILDASRFQCAYLHLQLSGNAVWRWTRPNGWSVLRASATAVR